MAPEFGLLSTATSVVEPGFLPRLELPVGFGEPTAAPVYPPPLEAGKEADRSFAAAKSITAELVHGYGFSANEVGKRCNTISS